MFRTHREDTNETEVSVSVVKAMYTANRRCAMKRNIFLHGAMLPNVTVQQIAIAFLHIWNEDPKVRFGHIRRQWATINFCRRHGLFSNLVNGFTNFSKLNQRDSTVTKVFRKVRNGQIELHSSIQSRKTDFIFNAKAKYWSVENQYTLGY